MKKPDIHRLLEFHELLDRFASIERIIHIKRHEQYVQESDTEHSYNLAMMAWFIAEYFPEISRDKVIRLALVHDLVEIHAGDTYAFGDKKLIANKAEREAAAQKRLAAEWQDFPDLHESITEYEGLETSEACFVFALDKIMPSFAIYLNDGYTWREKQITLKQLQTERAAKVAVSPQISRYWDALYGLLVESPHLFGPH